MTKTLTELCNDYYEIDSNSFKEKREVIEQMESIIIPHFNKLYERFKKFRDEYEKDKLIWKCYSTGAFSFLSKALNFHERCYYVYDGEEYLQSDTFHVKVIDALEDKQIEVMNQTIAFEFDFKKIKTIDNFDYDEFDIILQTLYKKDRDIAIEERLNKLKKEICELEVLK